MYEPQMSSMNNNLTPFHLAMPVNNIESARKFYGGLLGCEEGRSDNTWVDFNLFGHQFVVHLDPNHRPEHHHNPVDGHQVPVPHFGVVLEWDDWHRLADKLNSKGIEFVIPPYIRFQGLPGEQATMFFKDPSGNALEFKAFKDPDQLFAR